MIYGAFYISFVFDGSAASYKGLIVHHVSSCSSCNSLVILPFFVLYNSIIAHFVIIILRIVLNVFVLHCAAGSFVKRRLLYTSRIHRIVHRLFFSLEATFFMMQVVVIVRLSCIIAVG